MLDESHMVCLQSVWLSVQCSSLLCPSHARCLAACPLLLREAPSFLIFELKKAKQVLRGWMSCTKSWSLEVMEAGFKSRSVWLQVLHLLIHPLDCSVIDTPWRTSALLMEGCSAYPWGQSFAEDIQSSGFHLCWKPSGCCTRYHV